MGNKLSSSSPQIVPSNCPPELLHDRRYACGTSYNSYPVITTNKSTYLLSSQPIYHQSMNSLHPMSGTDSGYMTSPADTNHHSTNLIHNWRSRHSRLSLNEGFFIDAPPILHPLPPPPFLALPPPSLKKFKKWQKKQKKLLKKMGSNPVPVVPQREIPKINPYARAYSVDNLTSHVFDGYADVPLVNKRSWKNKKHLRRSHAFGDEIPAVPPGPPKSTVSSGCSNGFTVSDEVRGGISAPSTNTSDRSHKTSVTDHSNSMLRMGSSDYCTSPNRSKVALGILHPSHLNVTQSENLKEPQMNNNSMIINNHQKSRMSDGILFNDKTKIKAIKTESIICPSTENCAVQAAKIDDLNDTLDAKLRLNNSDSEYRMRKVNKLNSHLDDHYFRTKSEHKVNQFDARNTAVSCNNLNIECTIPIKITPEAKKVLEKNAGMFLEKDVNNFGDEKISGQNETIATNYSQNLSTSSSINNTPLHSTLFYSNSLVRNADHGSTRSSLTQSSNIKTEVSDIDFSWVNDVENRLEKEIAFVKEDYPRHQQSQLPVRYFGMDCTLDRHQNGTESTSQKSNCTTNPITLKSMEVFGECDSRKELGKIHSDVKTKAAMFDNEATMSSDRKSCEQQQTTPYRYRPNPRTDVYIPKPDYQNYDRPLSVDTSQWSTRNFFNSSNKNNLSTNKINRQRQELIDH